MATPTIDATPTNSLPVWTKVGKSYILDSVTVTFSATNVLAQNEIMDIYDIPAYTKVEWGILNVTTAVTGVTDVNLGVAATGVTSNSLIDAADVSSTGLKVAAAAQTPGAAVGATAQVVTLTNIDADSMDDGVIQFIVKCTPLT